MAILEPGEIFGEIEALDNRPTAAVAESLNALEPVTVCEIQHKDYVQYLHQFPEIAIKVLKLVGAGQDRWKLVWKTSRLEVSRPA